ncbi:MAG: helix-turn-helix domain-containing protein [Roseburia sp.]|nr:helix-turn-helix domain-containing protein [Roseburia sp.]
MEKVRYMISDAANLVDVESHVLRYWEDELDLKIPRNEMGHRYYTKENIEEFQKIKELKEKGYQLKAIRMIVHNGTLNPKSADTDAPKETMPFIRQVTIQPPTTRQKTAEYAATQGMEQVPLFLQQPEPVTSNPEKMEQFKELMREIVGEAIADQRSAFSKEIGEEVSEQVLKEMNYLAREQEEAQEERYRKLDAAIREKLRKKEKSFLKWNKKKPSQV